MKIAIVGTGVSGLVLAHLLHPEQHVTLFEQNDYIGGHTNTVELVHHGRRLAIDTGFIVFNDWTYPNFSRLLRSLGVESTPTKMSFGVRDARTGLEYSATSLNALFADRRNLFRRGHYRFLAELLRFFHSAPSLLKQPERDPTLGEYLEEERYSRDLAEHFVLPMGAAIWSADRRDIRRFPARYFVRFFVNHGMLNVIDQPTWRVIRGGSQVYVKKLVKRFRDRIRLSSPVTRVLRHADHVEVHVNGHEPERFDQLVLATHSDQALSLLGDPSPAERDILGAIRYQPNEAVLHTDRSILPRRQLAWAAWNYHVLEPELGPVPVTYNMSMLQGIEGKVPFLVTLNSAASLDPKLILHRVRYHHPVYTAEALRAQSRHAEISGVNRTHYAGAYWGFGFHEDGVKSALRVADHFQRGPT